MARGQIAVSSRMAASRADAAAEPEWRAWVAAHPEATGLLGNSAIIRALNAITTPEVLGAVTLGVVAVGVAGASLGTTSAAAPSAASAVTVAPVVTSAEVAAAIDAAGVAVTEYATEAASAALLAAVAPNQKPSQAPPVQRPPAPEQKNALGLVATLAALGAVLLLPLP